MRDLDAEPAVLALSEGGRFSSVWGHLSVVLSALAHVLTLPPLVEARVRLCEREYEHAGWPHSPAFSGVILGLQPRPSCLLLKPPASAAVPRLCGGVTSVYCLPVAGVPAGGGTGHGYFFVLRAQHRVGVQKVLGG